MDIDVAFTKLVIRGIINKAEHFCIRYVTFHEVLRLYLSKDIIFVVKYQRDCQ